MGVGEMRENGGGGEVGGGVGGRAHPPTVPGASRGEGGAAGFGVNKRRPPPPTKSPRFHTFPPLPGLIVALPGAGALRAWLWR